MKFNYFARSYIKMNTDSVEYIQNVLLFRAIDEISNNFKTLRTNWVAFKSIWYANLAHFFINFILILSKPNYKVPYTALINAKCNKNRIIQDIINE